MSLAGKVFKNNITGDTIKVIDSFENIAILENKQKIDVKKLMDSNQYTEQIDPSSFFNTQGAYNNLAEKIKNIPTHMMQDDAGALDVTPTVNYEGFGQVSNESAIIMTTEEDEKAELARRYGASIDNSSNLEKQNQAFARILGDDADELPQVVRTNDEPVQRVEVQRDVVYPAQAQPVRETPQVEDPIITMFKRTKRNVEFKVTIDICDKIPRLDFIEMMEDSYEISMIDFLADEFTNKILKDPSIIKDSIKSKIKQLVYGAEISKEIINPQITDAVTQVEKHEPLSIEKEPVLSKDLETPTKQQQGIDLSQGAIPKKTTRKPRAKKETPVK